jgi:hypothetical protein
MIFSDLTSPAEAGFAKAGNQFPPRIKSGAGFFGIMRYPASHCLMRPFNSFVAPARVILRI